MRPIVQIVTQAPTLAYICSLVVTLSKEIVSHANYLTMTVDVSI